MEKMPGKVSQSHRRPPPPDPDSLPAPPRPAGLPDNLVRTQSEYKNTCISASLGSLQNTMVYSFFSIRNKPYTSAGTGASASVSHSAHITHVEDIITINGSMDIVSTVQAGS